MVTKQRTPTGVKNPENLKRVLVVDDEPLMRKIIARHLEGMVEVTTVASVEEAEELLPTHDFDIVATDYEICGGKNGLMLLELLDQHHSTVRRILMSGVDVRVVHSARVVERLAHAFLRKPFRREELISALGLTNSRKRVPKARVQSR